MEEVKKAISHHIFIFPFKWDYLEDEQSFNNTINERIDLSIFKKLLNEDDWDLEDKKINKHVEYNQYVYFYRNVRKAIYGQDNDKEKNNKNTSEDKKSNINDEIVKCFKFKGINEDSKYVISIEKSNSDIKEYSLNLTDIKLKVYKTGVANLIFFVENNEFYKKDDILRINDYGRRIYPQFLPLQDCKDSFLANITLKNISGDLLKKGERIKHNLGEEIYRESSFKEENLSDFIKISSVITDVLGKNFVCERYEDINSKIIITPVIDDRMFVMSFLVDNSLSNLISTGDYYNETWYKYIFIDNGYCTCQNDEMREKLIKESTYMRWSNYNTLYGITRYSFVVLANDSDFTKILINQFKTMYYEMVLLVLTDRASLLRFKDEASRIAVIDENKALKNVKDLQKLYICFANSIYFKEVTAQEQGIEMYDMLLEKMRIKESVDSLGEDIGEIYNYTNGVYNDKINKKINYITFIGGIIGIVSLIVSIMSFFTDLIKEGYQGLSIPTIFTIGTLTVLFSVDFIYLAKKQIRKKGFFNKEGDYNE